MEKQLRDEITRLQDEVDQLYIRTDAVLKESAEDKAENEQLRTLGPMHAASFVEDPKHLLFVLARYQFVARMLTGRSSVLELGCGDGTGARLVAPVVGTLTGFDRKCQPGYPGGFVQGDLIEAGKRASTIAGGSFDAIYSLDVFEHVPPAKEIAALRVVEFNLSKDGVFILGMPSYESQPWASENSRREHVNCKTESGLRSYLAMLFSNVFLFGMNDATLHTGFGSMCHYRLALCTGKRTWE